MKVKKEWFGFAHKIYLPLTFRPVHHFNVAEYKEEHTLFVHYSSGLIYYPTYNIFLNSYRIKGDKSEIGEEYEIRIKFSRALFVTDNLIEVYIEPEQSVIPVKFFKIVKKQRG